MIPAFFSSARMILLECHESLANSHMEAQSSTILLPTMEPEINKNVLINTKEDGTLQPDLAPLTNILQRFQNTTQLLEK